MILEPIFKADLQAEQMPTEQSTALGLKIVGGMNSGRTAACLGHRSSQMLSVRRLSGSGRSLLMPAHADAVKV